MAWFSREKIGSCGMDFGQDRALETASPLGVPCSLVNKRAPVGCAQAELPHRYFIA